MDYSRYFWQGEKVRLRPVRAEDAEQAWEDRLDSPARQVLQLGVELPTTVEAMRERLGLYANCREVDGVILFTIETLAGENVGGISLHSRDLANGTFSFGIVIRRQHWGQGYAYDAVRILLKYSFWEQRYQKCNSACVHTNEASYHLHKKLGFVEEGRRRRQTYFNGQYYDEILFGMTKEEFDARLGR